MYYNGIDCYYFSGVKNIFRKVLNDKEIDDKEVVFVLKMKDFPFKTVSNGKRGVGVYNKNIINSYFRDRESVNEIKRIIEKYRNDDIADLVAQIKERRIFKPYSYDTNYAERFREAQENNKEKMIAYLNSLDKNPEEDMDAMSKKLLIDDDVLYESQGIINDKLYELAEIIYDLCEYYVENEFFDDDDVAQFEIANDVWDKYRKLYNIPSKNFHIRIYDNRPGTEAAAVSIGDRSKKLDAVCLDIRKSVLLKDSKNDCLSLIMHELTHMVDYYANAKNDDDAFNRLFTKYGSNITTNKICPNLNDEEKQLIHDMFYYFDKTEINARISECYYKLLHDESTQEYLSDVDNKNIREKIYKLYNDISDHTYVYEMENIIKNIYDDNIIYDFDDDYEENSGLTARYEKFKEEATILSEVRLKNKNYDKNLSSYIKRKLDLVTYLQDILDDFNKRIFRMLYKLVEDVKNKKYIRESKEEDLSDVDTDWKPKEGLFLSKSPRGIANYLLKHSKDKGQAMKRLTFYMNRAGDNLTNKTVLNKVKDLLKTDESLHEWNCADGFYIKERPFNISLNESYADLPKIEKNQKIPNELYLEKYPNLRLSRMLGNEYLIGDNWKKYPYKRSYYFEIKMNIDNPKFKYNDIFGLLRISDHKVNPYKFANEFGNVYVVNGKKFRRGVPLKIKDENGKVKKYAFGIAITLPFTKDLTVPQDDAKYEPHVFEYISTDFADEDIDNLKDLLDNIVKKMETATVGIKDKFSPYEYKEVTIKGVNTVFDISNDDRYIYNRNKTANIKLAREATSDNQTIRRTGIKRLNPVERNLDYYINKLNMEPTVITVNKRKKQANQTVNYNGNIYRAIELQNLLRPYNFKSKSVIGFKDGLYVWKDEDENILAAAIVENRELKKIDL